MNIISFIKNVVNDINRLVNNHLSAPQKPYSFITTQLLCMPIHGIKCPCCLAKGKTVWVIPGKSCPVCGTQCGRNVGTMLLSIIPFISVLAVFYTVGLPEVLTFALQDPMFFYTSLFTASFGLHIPHILLMPIPGVKCPTCLAKGKTVWVIPGKNCPICGTPCGKNIGITIAIALTYGAALLLATTSIDGTSVGNAVDTTMLSVFPVIEALFKTK